MRTISTDSLRNLRLDLNELKGNSVNSIEVESLIKEYLSLIQELNDEGESENLLESLIGKGENLVNHLNEMYIHASANYWAKERHVKYSKEFEDHFNMVKETIKYRNSY